MDINNLHLMQVRRHLLFGTKLIPKSVVEDVNSNSDLNSNKLKHNEKLTFHVSESKLSSLPKTMRKRSQIY
jgi:hypothetical protein